MSVAPRCGCSTAPSPDRLRHIEPESDPNQHPAAWPLRERGALRLDGDFGSVVVKLLPVLAQPTHFMLPTRPHRPQQPPERLLVAWLAQVTQLVNDVVQDVGGCEQQAPREGKVPAARARPPTRPRVTDGDGSKFEAETLRFLANDFSYATSGLAAYQRSMAAVASNTFDAIAEEAGFRTAKSEITHETEFRPLIARLARRALLAVSPAKRMKERAAAPLRSSRRSRCARRRG